MTLTTDQVLIEALTAVQRFPVLYDVGIVAEGPNGVFFQSASAVREWMGPDFPTSEDRGAVQKLCQVGYQLTKQGELLSWAVVARRGLNRWEIFYLRDGPPGQVSWGNKVLAWDGIDPVAELEEQWASLREAARLTADEQSSRVVSRERFNARDRLLQVLLKLADEYEARGQQVKKDAVRVELGPLLEGGLMVRDDGPRELRFWRS